MSESGFTSWIHCQAIVNHRLERIILLIQWRSRGPSGRREEPFWRRDWDDWDDVTVGDPGCVDDLYSTMSIAATGVFAQGQYLCAKGNSDGLMT